MAAGEDGEMRFRKRLRAACLRVATIAEANIHVLRTKESIGVSRKLTSNMCWTGASRFGAPQERTS